MRNWTKLYFQYGHHGGHIWNRIQKLNANFGVLIGGNMCAKFHICMPSGFGEEDVYGRRTTNDVFSTTYMRTTDSRFHICTSRPWHKPTGLWNNTRILETNSIDEFVVMYGNWQYLKKMPITIIRFTYFFTEQVYSLVNFRYFRQIPGGKWYLMHFG